MADQKSVRFRAFARAAPALIGHCAIHYASGL
jgi:hypothetical protein